VNDVVPFAFEGHQVRVIQKDGEPWFVLADVCRVLAIANIGNIIGRLDPDEKDEHQRPQAGPKRPEIPLPG
jgi:prophage antirepressor-like protein